MTSSAQIQQLVIASGNAGKVAEFRDYLMELGLPIAPKPEDLEIEETGSTFIENAHLKASQVAIATKSWAIADDSGLEINALNGAPGVLSARYAETDALRIEKVLKELAEITDRQAQFVCAIAIANPDGQIVAEAIGTCQGVISDRIRGTGGFGYDPIFLIPELQQTFGEVAPSVKAKISHRAKALEILRLKLKSLVAQPNYSGA
ncbi:MAG: RdgB/HAM1 family non-canonical purine NTP pyrophosphatase [Pseudanabaenaceae cyanobacterium bins.39]|nr:RdgB/HAM1 family non-canonical purine NTP pyrophosphatase [Pseudanabaenaceae cyanobacterium bins.39]